MSTGCTKLATIETNESDALVLLRKACKENDPAGCFMLGERSEPEIANGLYDKACKNGFNVACAKQECMANRSAACLSMAKTYETNTPFLANPSLSVSYYDKACQLGNETGCVGRAKALIEGNGIEQNIEKGLTLIKTNCSTKKVAGCTMMGDFHHQGKYQLKHSLKIAYQMYGLGCNGGNQDACVSQAKMLLANKVIKPDKALARDLLNKACKENQIEGCHQLAVMLDTGNGVIIDKRKAAKLYLKSCQAMNLESCNNLGDLHAKGLGGIKTDKKRAARLYKKSCNNGNSKACHKLGVMLTSGKNTVDDKAVSLFDKACSGGVEDRVKP